MAAGSVVLAGHGVMPAAAQATARPTVEVPTTCARWLQATTLADEFVGEELTGIGELIARELGTAFTAASSGDIVAAEEAMTAVEAKGTAVGKLRARSDKKLAAVAVKGRRCRRAQRSTKLSKPCAAAITATTAYLEALEALEVYRPGLASFADSEYGFVTATIDGDADAVRVHEDDILRLEGRLAELDSRIPSLAEEFEQTATRCLRSSS
ncbi:MAG: hypothetical protein EXQ79_04970 [Acidimicrobiia bacterium]|nr:hypothetical protein [Acidimicrobiia bacterium]